MTHSAQWPAELTRMVGKALQKYRSAKRPRVSAEQLAAAVSTLGMPYTRTQVTNLESGRRTSITLGEVLAFAAVLEVAPALLIFPIGTDAEIPILPGQTTNPWEAYQCFIGEHVLSRFIGSATTGPAARQSLVEHPRWATKLPGRDNPVAVYRQHANALAGHQMTRDDSPAAQRYLMMLAAARIEMHRHGWKLPEIEPAEAEAIAEPLIAWGYQQEDSGELIEVPTVPDFAQVPDYPTTEGIS